MMREMNQNFGIASPFSAQAAISVFCIRQMIVMGPTPPGTGVIPAAISFAAS